MSTELAHACGEEKLIDEVLWFLESSSSEEESEKIKADEKTAVVNDPNKGEPLAAKNEEAKERSPGFSIELALEKIRTEHPIVENKENDGEKKSTNEDIWNRKTAKKELFAEECPEDWSLKLQRNCRRSNNSYVQEVNRAIYGTTDLPAVNSIEYFQAAQNYAIHGKDFLDAPQKFMPMSEMAASMPADTAALAGENGLLTTPLPIPTELAAGVSLCAFNGFGKQSGVPAAASSHYQVFNGAMQPSIRQASSSTAYGMVMGNKITYVGAGPTSPSVVFNQTNFFSNGLGNPPIPNAPPFMFANPMQNYMQNYVQNFIKDAQYSSGGAMQGIASLYERMCYAQILQNQLYLQSQQQAANFASMFQHKHQRSTTRPTNTTSGSTAPSFNIWGRQNPKPNNLNGTPASPPALSSNSGTPDTTPP